MDLQICNQRIRVFLLLDTLQRFKKVCFDNKWLLHEEEFAPGIYRGTYFLKEAIEDCIKSEFIGGIDSFLEKRSIGFNNTINRMDATIYQIVEKASKLDQSERGSTAYLRYAEEITWRCASCFQHYEDLGYIAQSYMYYIRDQKTGNAFTKFLDNEMCGFISNSDKLNEVACYCTRDEVEAVIYHAAVYLRKSLEWDTMTRKIDRDKYFGLGGQGISVSDVIKDLVNAYYKTKSKTSSQSYWKANESEDDGWALTISRANKTNNTLSGRIEENEDDIIFKEGILYE